MELTRDSIMEVIREVAGDNAPYVAVAMEDDIHFWSEYVPKHDSEYLNADYGELEIRRHAEVRKDMLSPVTAKVGEGATINLWTDRHACTIVKVTPKTVTVRRDKAIRDPDFKPEWEIGGFSAICTNQEEQRWIYEPDPKGEVTTFHWSGKYNSYGRPGNCTLSAGRHEFYDYNF